MAGYNLYGRSASSGSYAKVNEELITGASYEDTAGGADTIYDYAITSVDSAGDESVFSRSARGLTVTLSNSDSNEQPAEEDTIYTPAESTKTIIVLDEEKKEYSNLGKGCFIDMLWRSSASN